MTYVFCCIRVAAAVAKRLQVPVLPPLLISSGVGKQQQQARSRVKIVPSSASQLLTCAI